MLVLQGQIIKLINGQWQEIFAKICRTCLDFADMQYLYMENTLNTLILFKEIVSWILLILFSIFIFSYWNWPEIYGLSHCYVHRGSSVWSYCWVIFFFFKGTVREKNCLDVFTHLIAVIYKYEYWHTACEEKNLCVCEDTRSNFFAKRNSSRNYLSKKMVQYLVTLSL